MATLKHGTKIGFLSQRAEAQTLLKAQNQIQTANSGLADTGPPSITRTGVEVQLVG